VEPQHRRRVVGLMRHSILALEICARFDQEGRLHGALRQLLANHPANANHQQKWQFYKNACDEIRAGFSFVEKGCWDYYDDDQRAQDDYDQWVSGMMTEEGSRTEPAPNDPYRNEPRYLTFTMAFLLVQGTPGDMAMRELCSIPEADLWKRASFWRILGGLRSINFANVKSDCAYLIPRDPEWGLTPQDLAQPKFHYLRPIEG
jgi:hypothetical protein